MKAAPFIALAAMATSGTLITGVKPIVNVPDNSPANPDLGEEHASATLLGQFRTSMSAWLWLRTDLYLHNGVEMRQMTDDERKSGIKTNDAADDGHEKIADESSVLTIVPPKERDFRGIFGDVERETSAYKDMHNHNHNDPVAALPLFRLMTWLDPSFIPGWVQGGTIIARERSHVGTNKALAFLKQGLAENPKSIAILTELGQLTITRNKDFKGGAVYLEQARAVAHRRETPFGPSDIETLEQTYRWLGLAYREQGRHDKMRMVAEEGLKIFHDDAILARMILPPPLILSPQAQRLWQREHSSARP